MKTDQSKTKVELVQELQLLRRHVSAQDVTRRKQLEEEKEQSQSLLKATLESAANGILVVAMDGRWSRFNQKFAEMWRIPSSICKSGDDKLALEYVLDSVAEPTKFLAKVKKLYNNPVADSLDTVKMKDGRIFERCSQPHWLEDEVVGRVWSFRDITEYNRLNKLNMVLLKIAQASNKTEDIPKFLELIRTYLNEIIDTTTFYVGLYDESNDTINEPYSKNAPGELTSYPAKKTLSGYVINTAKSLFADEKVTARLVKEGFIEVIGAPSKLWLGVPLRVKNTVIGTLVVQSYTDPNLYREKDIEVLEYVSNEIAKVIRNKQAANELQESVERYRTLFDSSRDAIMTLTTEEGFLSGNVSSMQLFGCKDEEEFISQTPITLSPEYQSDGTPSLEKAQQMMEIAMEKGSHFFEWTHKRMNGQEFPATVLLTRMELQGRNILQATIRDISERKQAEEALKSSEKRFKILFGAAPDAYYLSDLKGNFIDGNKAAIDLMGYTKEELIGKSFLKLKILSAKGMLKASKNLMKNTQGKGTGPDEFILNRKDGSQVPVEVRTYPVKINDETVVLGIARDITERKQAENALRDANSLKETLLDVIAHDLKNPAGVIKGFAQFGLENDPNSEILDEINKGTDNLLKVIDNATTLSKVTIGDAIEKEELDLTNIINNIINENLSLLQLEGMTLDMRLKGELIVNANPIIGEVFRNYISNAIKYAKTGKKVVIDSNFRNGDVTINFKDYGETIENKDRENIFLRNVQLDKTKGRGLGLAIVKRIAIAHDAEVGVKPNKPKGNNFYIKIPVS